MKRERGFSFVELLAALTVILALAALLLPVFSKAKGRGHEAVRISNLQQCARGVLIYGADYDQMAPSGSSSRPFLETLPVCDKDDYWNKDCKSSSDPMVGSYGYKGYLPAELLLQNPIYLAGETTPLFGSIWESSHYIAPFQGDHADPIDVTNPSHFPDRYRFASSDGSVRLGKFSQGERSKKWLTWSLLFYQAKISL